MSDLPTKDEAETPEAAPDAPEAAAAAPENAPERAPETAPESTPDAPEVPEAPAPAAAPARAAAPAPRRGFAGLLATLALLVALGALGANFMLWQRLGAMKGQLARQSQDTVTRAEAAGEDSRQAREAARNAGVRMTAVEGRVADMAQWRDQLQELLRNAAHARDENMAVELEAALLAAQELSQLTGSVQPMLAALRTAERRLARNVDPELLPVARAVAQDLEALRAAPAVDAAALLTRIERLYAQVDNLPVAAEMLLAPEAATAPASATASAPAPAEGEWWQQAARALGDKARALVRVSTLGHKQAGTLTPDQVFSLRERLRLHLQGARLALLGHRYEAAASDLDAAASLLELWFSPDSPRVQAALDDLRSLKRQSAAVQLPKVRATLRALGEVAGTVSAADAVPILPPDDAAPEAAPEKEAPASSDAAPQQPAPEAAAESASEPEPAADAASAAAVAAEDAAPAAEPAAEPASTPAAPEAPASVEDAAAQPQEASL